MNHAVIRRILGLILLFESAFLLLPCMVAVIYREKQGLSYLAVACICLVIGFLLTRRKTENQMFLRKGRLCDRGTELDRHEFFRSNALLPERRYPGCFAGII